jgi:type II secretory pathway pseudopilin PulG
MKNKRGDAIIIGLLIGLAIGGAMLYVESGNEAQKRANATGYEIHQSEVIAENPGRSAVMVFGPAVAGAGVGWALTEMSDSKKSNSSRDNDLDIQTYYGNVNVTVSGDTRQDNDTTTTTDTRTDTWRVE